jgi:predicted ribosome quality control (RQC) complex YloA/Tae2 family protein
MDKATLTDPTTEKAVIIPLERELNPVENAQHLYTQAKRIHRGRPVVTRRLERIERELSLLQAGLSNVQSGRYPDQSTMSLISPIRSTKRIQAPTSAKIYTIQGYTMQVGTNATQNDALLRKASPQDLWFHVKGIPGPHVILRCHDKQIPPVEVIREAAQLAAAGSKARDETRVEVSYTQVKYVRKPKGSPPGLVILRQEDTLTVNPTGKGVA